jgi:transposase InsO family protein
VCPLPVTALDGSGYILAVVDEATGYCAAIPVRFKAEIPGKFKRLLVKWQRQAKELVQCVRCDRGTAFLIQELESFLAAEGITIEPSCAYTPRQNGVAERTNRTLKENTRAMLLAADVRPFLWAEAGKCAAYLFLIYVPRQGDPAHLLRPSMAQFPGYTI